MKRAIRRAVSLPKKATSIVIPSGRVFSQLSQNQAAFFSSRLSKLGAIGKNQFIKVQNFAFSNKVIQVPGLGDSVSEGSIESWLKTPGEFVDEDEVIAELETDKVNIELRAPEAGKLLKLFAEEGDVVRVGDDIYELDTSAVGQSSGSAASEDESKSDEAEAPAKEEKKVEAPKKEAPAKKAPETTTPTSTAQPGSRTERREKMSRMRARIAQRLKDSQNQYALLTTFQECDMGELMKLRKDLGESFLKRHNIKLGFMSAFVKAATHGLQHYPIVNSVIDGGEMIHRDYIDISVAVATPKGLVVPVLRNCETKSFADIERDIIDYATKGRDGKLTIEDMTGGTFTISNGGVYGSLMGTPIINPPQSAILGMHSIVNKPVVKDGEIVARPMMYLALTYDHRILDGKDAVLFLRKIKDDIEDPRRLLIDV
eukprot:CAMPEP_0114978042 /NCGR_PEP_ID=MMETSP0216-20121206/3581_1 /TAXON_ID=223996 /ORGANISM="Protocruzia adherens, Strain Boccale" /LENGTH=427 /DNA_ID=CAMNT_0002339183 /DNA_START=42 /DNA_END=1325 /DNA_ORIENTATION=-